MFFSLSTWQLAFLLAGIMFGATLLGLVGRSVLSPSQGDPCASRSASCRARC